MHFCLGVFTSSAICTEVDFIFVMVSAMPSIFLVRKKQQMNCDRITFFDYAIMMSYNIINGQHHEDATA